MHYNIEFELCALIFLFVITIRFFTMRRFPNAQNRLFGIVLLCAIVDIVLDIVGSLTIENAAVVPVWINYLINTTFYILQAAFPAIMLLYVIVLRDNGFKRRISTLLLMLPSLVLLPLLISNIFTGLIFSVPIIDGSAVYTRGPMFNSIYLCVAFYIIATLLIALKNHDKLHGKQFNSIIAFIFILVAAVIIQFFYPEYLLSGVALTFAIQIMFFTLQNPEDMLDLISGVFNNSAMNSFLEQRISEKRQLWLVVVDVGGIRRVNSAFGVIVGDEVFAEIGKFLHSLKGSIWPFRMIGTRFLLVASNEEEYRQITDEIEERFQEPWHVRNLEILLTATIRYFGEWDFFKSPEDVVNLIDIAYSNIGPDGWGIKKRISTELLIQVKRRIIVENAIRSALATGEGFMLMFQPLYDNKNDCFNQVEALLRLSSPELGSISPSEFIPVAEKSGLILSIDEAVIRNCCEFYIRNERDLRGILKNININLSSAEFSTNPGRKIHRIIRDFNISPENICFEVTETAATSHPEILGDFMRDMKKLGYSFALDDFGTGYANLSRVISFPFDVVKLDRSLLLPEDENSMVLFESVLEMFSKIGISTVVEGVETDAQALRAVSLGADIIQGFGYAQPMREDDFISFIKAKAETHLV